MKTIKIFLLLMISIILGFFLTYWSVQWNINGISISSYISWCGDPSGLPFAFVGTFKNWPNGLPLPTCTTSGGALLTLSFIFDVIFWVIILLVTFVLMTYLYNKKFKINIYDD